LVKNIRPHSRNLRAIKTFMPEDLDHVWKALADSTRREILDLLRDGPRNTSQLVEKFPRLTRFGVMKHIDVLREAGLIHTRKQGRQRVNTLNTVPLHQIYTRWVSKYEDLWARNLTDLKESLEDNPREEETK